MSNGLVQFLLALVRAFAPADVPAPEEADRQSPWKRIDLTAQQLADRLEAQIAQELRGVSGVTVEVSPTGEVVVTCRNIYLPKVLRAIQEFYIFYPKATYGEVKVKNRVES